MIEIGTLDTFLLELIFGITVLILSVSLLIIKDTLVRLLCLFMTISYFIYSGFGIAYSYIDDLYFENYILFLICLLIPFVILGGNNIEQSTNRLDTFLENSPHFLRFCAIAYLCLLLVPLVYPEFKLFNLFSVGFKGLIDFYEQRLEYKSNFIVSLSDTIAVFFRPFFFIYLTHLQVKKTNTLKIVLLLVLMIFLSYSRYGYLSRYQMVTFMLLILSLLYFVKGYGIHIKAKYLALILFISFLSVPFLYSFTYIRLGEDADTGLSYMESLTLLLESEVYYPIYYDHTLTSPFLDKLDGVIFVLWLICLPIPSFIWPSKPKIPNDLFTYSLTGKNITDANYASSLPSLLGESFMFFKENYWLEALILGIILIVIIKYLRRHRSLNFYLVYLIIMSLTIGRGGASSYMANVINGVAPILYLHIFLNFSHLEGVFNKKARRRR